VQRMMYSDSKRVFVVKSLGEQNCFNQLGTQDFVKLDAEIVNGPIHLH
jgi:hypothetical protein